MLDTLHRTLYTSLHTHIHYKHTHTIDSASQFCEQGSIELARFLRADKYTQVVSALAALEDEKKHTNDVWTEQGPFNKRHYYTLNEQTETGMDTDCDILTQLWAFLRSSDFAAFIKHMTGLTINAQFTETRCV
jgi:hypothetical protein